ncbi:CWC16 protein [Artemisia annua]|uniref:CWC16 protein n=1 Tax=Artemisia annua TaxID=35608 RepID=A0A2U1QMI9_ARTAN|nr:CWC16 protein [Artemisia annua]
MGSHNFIRKWLQSQANNVSNNGLKCAETTNVECTCIKKLETEVVKFSTTNIKHMGFSEEEYSIICSLSISIGSRMKQGKIASEPQTPGFISAIAAGKSSIIFPFSVLQRVSPRFTHFTPNYSCNTATSLTLSCSPPADSVLTAVVATLLTRGTNNDAEAYEIPGIRKERSEGKERLRLPVDKVRLGWKHVTKHNYQITSQSWSTGGGHVNRRSMHSLSLKQKCVASASDVISLELLFIFNYTHENLNLRYNDKKRVAEEEVTARKMGLGVRLLLASKEDLAAAKRVKFSSKFNKNREDKRALIKSSSIFSDSSYSSS